MKKIFNKTIFLVSMMVCILQTNFVLADDKKAYENQEYDNQGETVPKPVFQVGDKPSEPYPDGSTHAKDFLEFFNNTYLVNKNPIPLLAKKDVVWFPPQRAGDTSLELVARKVQGQKANCDNPGTYPIICEAGDFSTGEFCQACHDSVLFVEGGGLPQMAYYSDKYSKENHELWLSNWSQYGDWSTSIMRLAARDPIWQAQIETETNRHPYADPAVIQDVCFSCHGEMGERQLKFDHGMDQTYCTDIFYATIPGYLSEKEQGKPYPFTGDCEPIKGKPIAEHQSLYAKYGSLGRDGVSCETCHRIGPKKSAGKWNGKNFEVFYGTKNKRKNSYVVGRQTDNPAPLKYEFTATFEYDMDHILTPDPVDTLDAVPMKRDDNLNIAHAVNTLDKGKDKHDISYLRQSVICGTCHVLIVPQIPTAFKPAAPLPDTSKELEQQYPYYKRTKACKKRQKFAGKSSDKYGNPVTDVCVGLAYEQATYLEWINSNFASEEDNDTTCQGCHMPLVTSPSKPTDHTAIMAQSTSGLTPKNYRRHRFMGINLPVFEMYMQFPDVLGVAKHDTLVPPEGISSAGKEAKFIQNYLLNGQMAIVEQATSQANGNGLKPNSVTPNKQAATQINVDSFNLSADKLTADITVVNNTGHKFPSGAGFRRAFLKFEVLDASNNVIWVSGQTNPYGAICDGQCIKAKNGTYNLLVSEVNGGDPKKLQPHYAVVSRQDQVQVYEVQTVDDTGTLTSSTLSLFHDAKDNRLLPRGWKSPQELECSNNNNTGGEKIFGIKQCSAAYATEPQLKPLTVDSAIASDKHYTNAAYTGSDKIRYEIPRADIKGAKSVRITMEYQTIPPAYLAARFVDGYDSSSSNYLPATERSIYLTSHLKTDLPLKSEHPDNRDLVFSRNWTTSIYQTKVKLSK